MSRSRILPTLVLAAILATPCAYGAPREERSRPSGVVEQIWGFLTSTWAGLDFNIDPNGSIALDSDIGLGIDPHGPNSTGQEADSDPETDIGLNIDPHG